MDAIKYLRQEHKEIRQSFSVIKKIANTNLRKKKFAELSKNLIAHEKMEQKTWYPVLKKKKALVNIIKHLIDEEKSAAKALKKFKSVKFDFIWNLRFLKLKNDVEHHAKEEEQELFTRVRKLMTKSDLNTLGIKMRKYKNTLMK